MKTLKYTRPELSDLGMSSLSVNHVCAHAISNLERIATLLELHYRSPCSGASTFILSMQSMFIFKIEWMRTFLRLSSFLSKVDNCPSMLGIWSSARLQSVISICLSRRIMPLPDSIELWSAVNKLSTWSHGPVTVSLYLKGFDNTSSSESILIRRNWGTRPLCAFKYNRSQKLPRDNTPQGVKQFVYFEKHTASWTHVHGTKNTIQCIVYLW
jgi:hypothetical protein